VTGNVGRDRRTRRLRADQACSAASRVRVWGTRADGATLCRRPGPCQGLV